MREGLAWERPVEDEALDHVAAHPRLVRREDVAGVANHRPGELRPTDLETRSRMGPNRKPQDGGGKLCVCVWRGGVPSAGDGIRCLEKCSSRGATQVEGKTDKAIKS